MIDTISIINEIVTLTNITDTEKLNIYVRRAINAIKGYCNYKSSEPMSVNELGNEILPNEIIDAVEELAIYFYQNSDKVGITQATQGSRSATYSSDLPQEIKNLCTSYRRIRMIG